MATRKSTKKATPKGRARTTRTRTRRAKAAPAAIGSVARRDSSPKPPRTRGVAGATREAPSPVSATADQIAELDRAIEVVSDVIERLKRMTADDVAALALADRQARAHALSDARLAIEDLENAKLVVLNAAFESRRPELARATSQLADDLSRLQDTVAFIAAAASAVGIIADIVSVVA